jgi:hypothetical protein
MDDVRNGSISTVNDVRFRARWQSGCEVPEEDSQEICLCQSDTDPNGADLNGGALVHINPVVIRPARLCRLPNHSPELRPRPDLFF